MAEELSRYEEFETRELLNAQVPAFSIVRFSHSQSPFDIPLVYWQNMVDVNNHLLKYPLHHSLSDVKRFQQYLMRLHRIGVRGKSGYRYYSGQSGISVEDDEIGRLRTVNDLSVTISPSISSHLQTVAQICHDEDAFGSQSSLYIEGPYMRTIGSYENTTIDPNTKALEYNVNTISDDVNDQNAGMQGISDHAMLIQGTYGKIDFFPAPVSAIPLYLDQMRNKYSNAISEDDITKKVRFIAEAYRAGVICQPFLTVWNSISMQMVNNQLINIGLHPISHGFLDYEAMVLSPEVFYQRFTDVVMDTNVYSENRRQSILVFNALQTLD